MNEGAMSHESQGPQRGKIPFFFREKYAGLTVKGNFLTLAVQPSNVEQGEWIAHQGASCRFGFASSSESQQDRPFLIRSSRVSIPTSGVYGQSYSRGQCQDRQAYLQP